IILIALISSCYAVTVREHEIIVSIDKEGSASVTENYYLDFDHVFDENRFLETAKKNSSSLSAWRADYDFFYTPLTKNQENPVKSSSIQWNEKNNMLVLNYELNEKLASIISAQPREDTWKINDSVLSSFIESGLIKIPSNTKITFEIPFNAEITTEGLENIAVIEGNKITLSGISTNFIPLIYKIQKSITPEVDTNIVEEILSNQMLMTGIALFLILLCGITFIKRKTIETKIENYIVNHSEIEGKEAEEFDLDLTK
ncbi:MAG: hypothetical protein JW703_01085, partial [Candidatus Diapherotrites archaeon]|nr:hypothetical protein [Candidatus Diapherotrites archaeon]